MSAVEFALSASEVAMVLGFSVGFLYGEAFSRFDKTVRYQTAWFKGLSGFGQWLVSSLFDANHHFQVGLVVVLATLKLPFFADHPTLNLVFFWLGWGLVVSDLRDFRNVLKRLGLGSSASGVETP